MNKYFEEIYKENSDMVYCEAYSILRNVCDAEDVTIEVFCKLYKYMLNSQCIHNVPGWLRISARTTAIDLLRKNSRSVSGHQPAAYQKSHDDATVNRVFINDMLDELYKHNPKWFEYLAMRFLLDMSYDEISLATGVSVAAVKNSISRAKQFLAKKYSSGGSDSLYPIIFFIISTIMSK